MKLRFLLVGLPLSLSAGATVISACSAKHDEAAPLDVLEGGATPFDASHPLGDANLTKPPRTTPSDGGTTSDAPPPPPPPTAKDGGGTDADRLGDSDVPDAQVDDAGTVRFTPLDSVDGYFMPTKGVDVGRCVDLGFPDQTGICKTNSSTGQDFVEGCVAPEAYILDCQRYETAGKIRSICTDDHQTNVGCHLLFNMGKVDAFERGQTARALDEKHNCPPSWEGYAYCAGDYVRMCVNGKDWALDCKIYNNSTFTYTCGNSTPDASVGDITCL